MKAILNEVGPIAVSINASLKTFQLYRFERFMFMDYFCALNSFFALSQGIYDDKDCSEKTVNHAMLLVGYDEDYWILKNWW